MENAKRAVLVLGMHRSGTSALTRVVNLMGFRAPRTLMPANEGNADGYWESLVIVDLNERLLQACGGSWHSPGRLKAEPLEVARRSGLYDEMRRALSDEFGTAPHIVLKCPRISRLMGVYGPLLDEAGYRVSPLLAVRNPLEVAASLAKRDKFGLSRGLGIWLRYTLDSERATRGRPRAVVTFDGLLADWKGTMSRAEHQLAEPWPLLGAEPTDEISAALKPGLRHHRQGESRSRADRLSWRGFLARQAYDAMQRLAADPKDARAFRILDGIRLVYQSR
ncbi:sulfotransferase family protein [Xanthobacter sp. V7C-4]|uniref:sulfotransferase family protein n=1 Tax=Xanthobacter autotrophicus (strain ATCC BAA-1158 / Py2) TaxID=78245 RepID=UPI003728C0D9